MNTLYLDCSMGAAGDMLSAALLELMPDPEAAVARLNALGVPGVEYVREKAIRCGIAGTRLAVKIHGAEEGHHHHHHEDGHHGHHEHHGLDEILHLVEHHLSLPEGVRAAVAAVYRLLADAESRAHGRPVAEIHFHEVGMLDAVADISAACWLLSELAPDEIVASPVHVGCGSVQCAHGLLPVPAPATAFLLEGVPTYSDGAVKGELCTPTGAALLKHFVKRYGPMPQMAVRAVGHGAGTKDFEGRANLLRASIGTSGTGCGEDEVLELTCNIDDMTGEEIAFACERIFAAGARDVFSIPVTMKKGRPGVLLQALCAPADRDAVSAAVFKHTTTLGIRETLCRRQVLERREERVALPDGTELRRKVSEGHGVRREKLEYDDVARLALAQGMSLREASKKAAEVYACQ